MSVLSVVVTLLHNRSHYSVSPRRRLYMQGGGGSCGGDAGVQVTGMSPMSLAVNTCPGDGRPSLATGQQHISTQYTNHKVPLPKQYPN